MDGWMGQVPYHLKDSDLGDRWDCSENIWNPMYVSCNVPQALSNEQIDAILESAQDVEDQGEMSEPMHPQPERPSTSEYTANSRLQ